MYRKHFLCTKNKMEPYNKSHKPILLGLEQYQFEHTSTSTWDTESNHIQFQPQPQVPLMVFTCISTFILGNIHIFRIVLQVKTHLIEGSVTPSKIVIPEV